MSFYKYLKSIGKMNSKELRNLQEAYMKVVENQQQLDEENRGDEYATSSMYMSREPETTAAKVRRRQKRDGLPDNASHKGDDKDYDRQFAHKVERGRKKLKAKSDETLEGPNRNVNRQPGKYAQMQSRKSQGLSYKKEQVDLYDIILSHLLDEGYASTEEAAEAIMVNMSEDWRDSIIDEMLDEAVLGAKKGTIRSVIGKGGKSIKYVQSGGDIVAGDRAAAARASDAERIRSNKNRANAARAEQARKKSIKNLNAKPGENTQNYGNTDYGHNTPSRYDKNPGGPSGDSHYNLTHSNRAARKRRESGR